MDLSPISHSDASKGAAISANSVGEGWSFIGRGSREASGFGRPQLRQVKPGGTRSSSAQVQHWLTVVLSSCAAMRPRPGTRTIAASDWSFFGTP